MTSGSGAARGGAERRVLGLLTLLLGVASCAPPPVTPPNDTRRTVLSLRELSCVSCAERLAQELDEQAGVKSARFDPDDSRIVVLANPAFDALRTAEKLKGEEPFEVVEGAEIRDAAVVPGERRADVETLATDGGRDVPDLGAHAEPGKITVFDFSADWCEPCRMLDEHLRAEVERRPDLAYRKLDIGERDSALAKRYLGDDTVLPHVIVFGKDGREAATIEGFDVRRLDEAIERAGAPR